MTGSSRLFTEAEVDMITKAVADILALRAEQDDLLRIAFCCAALQSIVTGVVMQFDLPRPMIADALTFMAERVMVTLDKLDGATVAQVKETLQ